MKPSCTLAALLVLWPAAVLAQWSGGITIGTLFDDNSFNNALQIRDRLTEVALQGAHDWETETSNVQLFYNGTLDYFALLPSRTYLTHSAGVVHSRILGEDENAQLNAGGTFTLRDNRDEFTLYDHFQWSLYGNFRLYLSELALLKGGYSFRSAAFAELPELDYLEHVFFLQSSISLPTRTTFIVQSDLGLKNYTTPDATETWTPGAQGGRMGTAPDESTPGVTQLIGTLRIGQGITEQTGLSLTGQYQTSLRKDSRYLTLEDAILTDDEIFDDHYGYDGPLVSLMATQLLPAGLRLRASGTLQERQYSDRPAYDMLGNEVAPQRIDTRSVISVSLDATFSSIGLQASLLYEHILNHSNDAFYDYRNDAISLWLSVAH